MIQSKEDAKAFTIAGGVAGLLYPPGPNKALSIAVVEQDGTYPQQGWSINDTCTETFYVLEGSLEVTINGTSTTLQSGDVCSIQPGNKYQVHGTGKTIDIITPAWDKKQNHIIDDNGNEL